jgi:hypothetical protein
MKDMIEKAVEALRSRHGYRGDTDVEAVRIILEVMREPNQAMLSAARAVDDEACMSTNTGGGMLTIAGPALIWRAMIDAALSAEQPTEKAA